MEGLARTFGDGYLAGDDEVCRRAGVASKILVALIGQSNAESHATAVTLSMANLPLASAYANVSMVSQQDRTFGDDPMIWQTTTQQALQSTMFDQGAGSEATVGLELTMMRDLDIAKPQGFALARIAVGGSGSVNWDPASAYPTSPPAGPNLCAQAIAYIQAAMVTLGCSSLVLVWEQGETDAKTVPLGTAYLAWLQGFVDHLRAAFGNLGPGGTAVPFVYGRDNADATPATYPGLAALRASQDSFESTRSLAKKVSLDSLPQSSGFFDGTHYTADGYIKLGHLFSPAVASFCGIRIQPVASFTFAPSALVVAFTDTSVSYGDAITAWDWDWGDATAHGTTQNPSHTYAASGTYNVTLTVTNTAADANVCAPVAVSVISGIAGVTRDALSEWYVPASVTEWPTFLTAIASAMSAPDALWLCQEAAGSLADSIGSVALTAANAPAYRQALAGWTRKWCGWDGSGLFVQRFSSSAAALPNLSTTDVFTIAYVAAPASNPAAARAILTHGTIATRSSTDLLATGFVQDRSVANLSASGASAFCGGGAHFVGKLFDRTNSRDVSYTESEKLVATLGPTAAGNLFTLGAQAGGFNGIAGGYLYVAQWWGAKARVTDAQVKALAAGLTGLTIPWS